VFDSLFQFLFEYRPVVFRQGEFRFAPAAGAYVALVVAVVAVFFAIVTYRRAAAASAATQKTHLGLLALRLALIALLAFCLFRPVLVVKAAMAQQNFLAVLLDDSRSMQITDFTASARPRGDFAKQEFGDRNAGLLKALSDRFVVRTFRFSSQAARLGSTSELTFGGVQTRIGAALDGAR